MFILNRHTKTKMLALYAEKYPFNSIFFEPKINYINSK